MSMITNLHGRLRNTPLAAGNGLLPLFEAVINSIHAIDEADRSTGRGRIDVTILRDPQQTLELQDEPKKRGVKPTKPIVGFKVTDNGIGFNDVNMRSFETLDSEHKADIGGRGVGRLLWLKAFESVEIVSVFLNDADLLMSRSFVFNSKTGVSCVETEPAPENAAISTTVHLEGLRQRYRNAVYKTASPIASALFEHCLWYFVREGGAPKVTIHDGDDLIKLDDVYEDHMISSAETGQMSIKGIDFNLTHIKLRTNTSNSHVMTLCAASRPVREEGLAGRVPGLYGRLSDEAGDFVYACYVTSPFLDDAVRPERTGFDILESTGGLFADTEVSLDEIRDAVVAAAAEHLGGYLEENKERSKERVNSFVSNRAPRYRPILSRIPEDRLMVDPSITDKDLDLTLHRCLSEIEEQLLSKGHDVLNPREDEDVSEYEERLREYLRTAEDIKKSDLANYVSHRRVILELLESAIQVKSDGRYEREDMIHRLLVPMKCDSNEVEPDSCNLWLLDERLAFHDYLASDKPLCAMSITEAAETKEPDIIALNVFDNPLLVSEGTKLPLASIVVVEIKRPMRNDASEGEVKDPIEQALSYLDRVRKGSVKTATGRPIPGSENIPGFCYVICDITPSIARRCRMHDAIRTSDGMGFFVFKKSFDAYVEVISFDRLVNAAKERNRAFFDKLGLPTR